MSTQRALAPSDAQPSSLAHSGPGAHPGEQPPWLPDGAAADPAGHDGSGQLGAS